MIKLQELSLAISEISKERKIPKEKVIDIIETSLASAWKKELGNKFQKIRAEFDELTGETRFFLQKEVVDKDMILTDQEIEEFRKLSPEEKELEVKEKKIRFNPERHILLDDAKKIKKDAKVGDIIEFEQKSPKNFGRIAIQTAKQVLLQKIREAEREKIFDEFKNKEGEIVTGIIQRKEQNVIFVDLGGAIGIFPKEEQIPGEFYKPNARMRFYVLKVHQGVRGPEIYLSRAYPKFVSKLFEIEVPEISEGIVEIKAIARIPGVRSKIAVSSSQKDVDAVGACVGTRGTRVNMIIQELGREKIDVVEYSDDPKKFVANAISPAKPLKVSIKGDKAIVTLPPEEISFAVGKNGQNVKLASDLTGWKIELKEQKFEDEVTKEELTEKSKEISEEVSEETAEKIPEEIIKETTSENPEKIVKEESKNDA